MEYYITIVTITGWWLSPTPLKNMSSSVGVTIDIPKIWKNKSHVPNHQPEYIANKCNQHMYSNQF